MGQASGPNEAALSQVVVCARLVSILLAFKPY